MSSSVASPPSVLRRLAASLLSVFWRLCLVLILVVLFAAAFLDADDAHAQFLAPRLPTIQGGDYGNGAASSDVAGGAFMNAGRAHPAVAFGTPTAFGPRWGDVFVAAGMQRGLRHDPTFTDGALFAGLGLGNPRRTVGVGMTLAVYDVVGETLKDGSWSVKVHRRLGAFGVAAGVENAGIFGTTDGGRSRYLVTGGVVPVRPGRTWLPDATLSLGVGDGRFTAWRHVRNGVNHATVFGSAAVSVVPWGGLLTTWTGQNLNLGASVSASWQRVSLTVTPVLLDAAGSNRDARFALGTGVAVSMR